MRLAVANFNLFTLSLGKVLSGEEEALEDDPETRTEVTGSFTGEERNC